MRRDYNKIVRDKIPELLKKQGKSCEVQVLSDKEYILKLKEKLKEDTDQFLNAHESQNIGEMADIIEVIYAIAEHRGITEAEVDFTRQIKRKQRGGFKKRILLKSVSE
ncbi:nucleoside triphosphate pyrophosphohydrolase [Bacillus sp. T33-2]|uniref:nucleoside triphosphate pyrophosphohydrolase n=1 Tax=Bacillus sp. T33-2 TaxID=2054168 RepID=UPI000C7724CD|nr:nucleoside triphosphate pyrophosphohydrolase [Bacillus sp. T33-2]PLR96802.1 phosphoribosyl-ATP pyrophosphohydrolase [Bacillus sp. T33-2]